MFGKVIVPMFIFASWGVYSCSDDNDVPTLPEEVDNSLVGVSIFVSPEDGAAVSLKATTPETQAVFAWKPQANTVNTPITYEVILYKEKELKTEIKRFASIRSGAGLKVRIEHSDLDAILEEAGFARGESCDLYWSINSIRGEESAIATASVRKITLTRLKDEFPGNGIYILGAATESGEDITVARAFTMVEQGKYEIYTKLEKDLDYLFVDNSGESLKYYSVADDKLVENDTKLQTSETGIYHISLNFSDMSYSVQHVTNLRHVNSWTQATAPLIYVGDGKWDVKDLLLTLHTNNDNRYYFRMDYDGVTKKLGSINANNLPPGSATGSYFYLYEYDNSSQWNNAFKYMEGKNVTGKHISITVYMYGESKTCSHHIEYLD